jgi:hypothetical protein
MSAANAGAPRRRWASLGLQLLGSIGVLFLLLRHGELDQLRHALAMVHPGWLLLAIPVKAISVAMHELRLYLALRPWGRPSITRVLGIGFTSGLVNTIVPLRGGDMLAVALLKLECRTSTPAAITAVGVASVVEAVAFGLVLLVILLVQGPSWAAGVAQLELGSALRDMGLITAAVTMVAVGLVIVLRRLYRRDDAQADTRGPGLLGRLADAGRGLGLATLAVSTILALVQVAFVFAVLLVLFRALGLAPTPALLAAGMTQAGGSLAATVLPQTLGAGQAASAVLVLATFGVPTPQALALAALIWATHQVVTLLLGGVPLWRRLGRLTELRKTPDPTASA